MRLTILIWGCVFFPVGQNIWELSQSKNGAKNVEQGLLEFESRE